jgi:hypothetical protein
MSDNAHDGAATVADGSVLRQVLINAALSGPVLAVLRRVLHALVWLCISEFRESLQRNSGGDQSASRVQDRPRTNSMRPFTTIGSMVQDMCMTAPKMQDRQPP